MIIEKKLFEFFLTFSLDIHTVIVIQEFKIVTATDQPFLGIPLLNRSRPNPGKEKKINLSFYFHTSLWCLCGFMKVLNAFMRPFEAPQRSVKIKI